MSQRAPSSLSRALRSGRGFGLLELMVAIVILAIGILGLAALVPMGTHSAAKSGEVTRASELASALAERLLAVPYGDPDLATGIHLATPYPSPGGYYLSWVVEDDQPIPMCKRVTIENHWPNPASPNRTKLVIVCPRANSQ